MRHPILTTAMSLALAMSGCSSTASAIEPTAQPTAQPTAATDGIDAKHVTDEIKRGRRLTKAKDYSGAINAFSRALDLDKTAAKAWSGRGYARMMEGVDLDGAQSDFEAALAAWEKPSFQKAVRHNLATLAKQRSAPPTAEPAAGQKVLKAGLTDLKAVCAAAEADFKSECVVTANQGGFAWLTLTGQDEEYPSMRAYAAVKSGATWTLFEHALEAYEDDASNGASAAFGGLKVTKNTAIFSTEFEIHSHGTEFALMTEESCSYDLKIVCRQAPAGCTLPLVAKAEGNGGSLKASYWSKKEHDPPGPAWEAEFSAAIAVEDTSLVVTGIKTKGRIDHQGCFPGRRVRLPIAARTSLDAVLAPVAE